MRNFYRGRLMCDVLEEMRSCVKTLNFGGLIGLVEEVQSLANRMESGLDMKRDLKDMDDEWTEKKEELRLLENKINQRKKEV